MIAGLSCGKIIAPFVFDGSCDSDLFDFYLENFLVKKLKVGSTLVLDNASFHRASRVDEILRKAGCSVLFLPPYSPDMNPIEKCWSPIKNDLRKLFRREQTDPIDIVCQVLRSRST